jgi:hypothetical protein
LNLSALGDSDACLSQALGQLVPYALERTQVEHPRLRGTLGGRLDAAHPGGSHKRFRKLALEASNLIAQRATRRPLVELLDGG